jgi:hypothetical protein
MGKRTRGATLPVLGVLFIAGGFYAATAAAQPVIQVGSGSGSPGGTATFSVTLAAGGAQVAATQNDITFDANTPVRVSTAGYCTITTTTQCSADANCPILPAPFTNEPCVDGQCSTTTTQACTTSADCPQVHEPCIPANGPACSVNTAIGKGGFFTFLPNGCTPTTLGNCTGVRALIVAVNNLNAITDGSVLYTCTVQIASGAASQDYPLTISNESAGDTSQALINEACTGGHCSVTTGQACTTSADCPSAVTGTNGMITVGGPVSCCGDSDSSGSISTSEATNAILGLVNRTPETDPAAQCTTPGTITTADATKVILNLVNRTCNP